MKLSQSCIYKLPILILSFLLVTQSAINAQNTYYVYIGAVSSSGNNGTIGCPFSNIGEAIAASDSGDIILITADHYNISATLNISVDLVIRGGYNLDYTAQTGYTTIDGGHTLGETDGVLVLNTEGLTSAASFDHLIIQHGYDAIDAIGGGMNNHSSSPSITDVSFNDNESILSGAGMFNDSNSSPILYNVNFNRNREGGMTNYYSSPILNNVNFVQNRADMGGGMNNYKSNPILNNVSFNENYASFGGGMLNRFSIPTLTNVSFNRNESQAGGGIYNDSSNITLVNVSFCEDSSGFGGGICNNNSSPILINVSFVENKADQRGAGMYNFNTTEDFFNPILYNTLFYYNRVGSIISDIEVSTARNYIHSSSSNNASDGNGAGIRTNPSTFVDLSIYAITDIFTSVDYDGADNIYGTSDDGLIPAIESPLINMGDNSYNDVITDLAGDIRVFKSTIDMGAYESQYVERIDSNLFLIYPNPITDKVFIVTTGATDLFIYNISGSLIKTIELISDIQEIDFSNYPSDMYLFKCMKGNELLGTQKVIKE